MVTYYFSIFIPLFVSNQPPRGQLSSILYLSKPGNLMGVQEGKKDMQPLKNITRTYRGMLLNRMVITGKAYPVIDEQKCCPKSVRN